MQAPVLTLILLVSVLKPIAYSQSSLRVGDREIRGALQHYASIRDNDDPSSEHFKEVESLRAETVTKLRSLPLSRDFLRYLV